MQDEYVKLEKGTVQVTRTGYGPTPLVLLSGFSTLFPGLEYGALGTELAKKFPVLIPSKFGYGYSDLTDAPRDADAIVEEYRAVLSALKVPTPVVLCAHSMGFLEALRWAQKYPEEVAALVGLDPATPEVYQTFDLTGSQARLEKINRPEWKRRLTFRLMASSMLSRYPSNLRRKLAPAARRNFACLTWVNESRALPENVRTIYQAGAPANIPALFLLSNGKGTPLPGEEWRKHALSYLDHLNSGSMSFSTCPTTCTTTSPRSWRRSFWSSGTGCWRNTGKIHERGHSSALRGGFLSGRPERNQRGARARLRMSAPRSYSPPLDPILRECPLEAGRIFPARKI